MNPLPFRKPPPVREESADTVEALQEQVGCYRRLAKLAQIQHEHVCRDQTEALLEVLQSRQQVLGEIGRLEAIVGPIKRGWSEFVQGLSEEKRSSAESLLAEAKQLLEEITTSDKNDVMVLQQRKINLGRQIGQATAARQINRNYATSAYGTARPRMDVQR